MNDINDLYQQMILDHNKSPRNFKKLENYTHFAKGHNPLCGDEIDIYVLIENNVIKDISFQGQGCAVSKSSASIMTTLLKGKTLEEAEEIYENFHKIVTSKIDDNINLDEMGKLAVFAGVRKYPTRVKCATLAWHTYENAKNGEKEITITE
ncbi:MAG TPA: SUF system NifU family Fe-S cluster assembly protein [Ignavibacteriales bacterium]|jgi:nitrogen fixation NifU-like protein|nr:SUF system NifU family Fe-S cluster assembly protein [Ignavibacteriales bacterium]